MNTKDYLSKLIVFDKKYNFKPSNDNNTLTVDALREVYKVISAYCNELNKTDGFFIDLPNTVNLYNNNPNDDWNKWYDESGRTWVKRYRDYVHDISGISLPPSLLGIIGETCARVKGIPPQVWVFDFHAGIDWQPGSFGESKESCLWNGYDEGRRLASAQGISAIRFYKGGRGIGRALLWLSSDGLLHVFNLYHKNGITREGVATMLVEFFGDGWTYINCNLESEDLYINGDRSSALYNTNIVKPENIYSQHSVIIDKIVDGVVMCAECFRSIPVEDATITYYGRYVCQECLDAKYNQCKICNKWHYKYHVGNDGICILCRNGVTMPF